MIDIVERRHKVKQIDIEEQTVRVAQIKQKLIKEHNKRKRQTIWRKVGTPPMIPHYSNTS